MAKVTIFASATAEAARACTEKLVEVASEMAGEIRSGIPVESGEWAAGITSGQRGETAYVASNDPESFWKEYGTADTPPHMVITNTARKFGKYSGMTGR